MNSRHKERPTFRVAPANSTALLEMPRCDGHPNRREFRGVLTIVDAPSDRSPSGARGHKVLLTRQAAEEALPSLLGMAANFHPNLKSHDYQRKVGIITRAELVTDGSLAIAGFLYEKDFPEIVERISACATDNEAQLGMSYEIADVLVEDLSAKVWRLTRITFTGASILRRDKAAYRSTWIEIQ